MSNQTKMTIGERKEPKTIREYRTENRGLKDLLKRKNATNLKLITQKEEEKAKKDKLAELLVQVTAENNKLRKECNYIATNEKRDWNKRLHIIQRYEDSSTDDLVAANNRRIIIKDSTEEEEENYWSKVSEEKRKESLEGIEKDLKDAQDDVMSMDSNSALEEDLVLAVNRKINQEVIFKFGSSSDEDDKI